ncbi:hypothetical protein QBC34DRAFT_402999 [Podospora aff. communis PSN243]|uniref:Uncharacterized protein n=1 Tax=Podospora aff. communis PSN243 TaxID=3040156 RepID=A0AAV9GQ99_9PEZI|nr:hypothetical protein QBC34DRAFT_402999 [Podospora aff. communis PSN243]
MHDLRGLVVATLAGGRNMTVAERIPLMASVGYGPAVFICWFLLLLSITIAWGLNPVVGRRDAIVMDVSATLFVPIATVVPAIRLKNTVKAVDKTVTELMGMMSDDNAHQIISDVEAFLAICEEMMTWLAVLYWIATRNGTQRRRIEVAVAGLLYVCCSSVASAQEFGPRLLLWSEPNREATPLSACSDIVLRRHLERGLGASLHPWTRHFASRSCMAQAPGFKQTRI